MQEGDFEIHVHIQDGLSGDSTLSIAKRWQAFILEDQMVDPEKITITIDSESDHGIYDAIVKGFARVPSSRNNVMTWLGSDDLLTNGSLATVNKIFQDSDEISWLTGRSQTIDAKDCLFSPWKRVLFSRNYVLSGFYDGRTFGFIQQEGTFWRSDLYHRVGGINTGLKYAGDFDLWRKFACVEKIYTLDFPLGIFRYREGQTSSDKASYYKEVEFVKANLNLADLCQDLNFNHLDEYSYSYLVERSPTVDKYKITSSINYILIPLQAFSEQMNAAPEQNIFTPYYWTFGKKSRFQVDVFGLPIIYEITLRVRNFHENQLLKIYSYKAELLGNFALDHDFSKAQAITFECNFNDGDTTLTLEISKSLDYDSEQGPLGIVIESLFAFPINYTHLQNL